MLAVSLIMKRRRRNLDSLTKIIYNVKNLTFLISTNFFIIVNQFFFKKHDFLLEKSSSDANYHLIINFASDVISHFTSNLIFNTEFENNLALSSTTNSDFNIIERRKSIQNNARNKELKLYTSFNMKRTFLRLQNTSNLYHFLISSSSFVQLTSKVLSFYSLINEILYNQSIKISSNEIELV